MKLSRYRNPARVFALPGPSAAHAKVELLLVGHATRRCSPTWARAGFSDDRPVMPYALGASDRIAAIVFGYPLLAPPGKTRNNKILWVSHSASGRSRI